MIASIFKPSKINGVIMYKKIKKIKLDDRIIIEIIGTDSKGFLQPLITNNIDLVSSKKSIYAALLSPQGKYIFDFFSLKTTFLITLQSQQVLNFFKTVECVLLSLNNLQTSLSFDCSSNLKIEQELTLSVTS